jgi:C4-type Zn-finger protein
MLDCPSCRQPKLKMESKISTEPHGEVHTDVRWTCGECGAIYENEELDMAYRLEISRSHKRS